MKYELAGFVADLSGNEAHFIQVDPVVLIEGTLFAARGLGWTREELVALTEGQLQYIYRFSSRRHIEPGDSVWLVGAHFYNDLSRALNDSKEVVEIGRWKVLPQGYRWSTGAPDEFRAKSNSLSSQLERNLRQALAREGAQGAASCIVRVYEVLESEHDRERFVNLGTFYHDAQDKYSLELLEAEAIASGAFLSRWLFRRAVKKNRREIAEFVSIRAESQRLEAALDQAGVYSLALHKVLASRSLFDVRESVKFVGDPNLFAVDDFNLVRIGAAHSDARMRSIPAPAIRNRGESDGVRAIVNGH